MIYVNIAALVIVLALAGAVFYWQIRRMRSDSKTYLYHIKVILTSGKIIKLLLDEELYQQFIHNVQGEDKRFFVEIANRANPQLQDALTSLSVAQIAAITMRRW